MKTDHEIKPLQFNISVNQIRSGDRVQLAECLLNVHDRVPG